MCQISSASPLQALAISSSQLRSFQIEAAEGIRYVYGCFVRQEPGSDAFTVLSSEKINLETHGDLQLDFQEVREGDYLFVVGYDEQDGEVCSAEYPIEVIGEFDGISVGFDQNEA